MNFIDPFSNELSFRVYLSRFKEYNELDFFIKFYVENILGHRIYQRPSKGPYGEKGKDLVAIENEDTLEYCSYIIKCGTLQNNLDGQFGIINQMDEAINIDLEEKKYKEKKRTAIIIHNGEEGYRGAINKFEISRKSIQSNISSELLLRDIERWDISILCQKIFPYAEQLKELERISNETNKQLAAIEIIKQLLIDAEQLDRNQSANVSENQIVLNVLKKVKDIERKYGRF